jgi:hypothetical protein
MSSLSGECCTLIDIQIRHPYFQANTEKVVCWLVSFSCGQSFMCIRYNYRRQSLISDVIVLLINFKGSVTQKPNNLEWLKECRLKSPCFGDGEDRVTVLQNQPFVVIMKWIKCRIYFQAQIYFHGQCASPFSLIEPRRKEWNGWGLAQGTQSPTTQLMKC